MSLFRKATKEQAKARIALIGPAGSGKTMTALKVAGVLADGGNIAVIDTERGSASKYADITGFDVCELGTHAPDDYVKVIEEAAKAGYGVLIIDSLSHAWSGKGGALEIVDKVAARSRSGNTYTAWREVTPMHNRLVNAILNYPGHVIATMRAKTEYVLEETSRGTKVPKKVGMAPVQREGVDYEFDIVGEIDTRHVLVVTKSRCADLSDEVIEKPGAEFGERIKAWLTDGSAPTEHVPVEFKSAENAPKEPKPVAAKPAPKPAPSKPAASADVVAQVIARIESAENTEQLTGVVSAAKSLNLSDDDRAKLNAAYSAKAKTVFEGNQ